MNGFLKDITYARSGEYILSIYTRESCKDIWKNFGERPITFTITTALNSSMAEKRQQVHLYMCNF